MKKINFVNKKAPSISADILNELQTNIENELFYKNGDTYKNKSVLYLGGHITGGCTNLCTNLSLPKRLDNISSITVNAYDITARKVEGGYILNRATTELTVSCSIIDNSNIGITIVSPTALETANNSPTGIAIYNLELIFNE